MLQKKYLLILSTPSAGHSTYFMWLTKICSSSLSTVSSDICITRAVPSGGGGVSTPLEIGQSDYKSYINAYIAPQKLKEYILEVPP